jgi:alpha-1,3-rhamnosyltransferase
MRNEKPLVSVIVPCYNHEKYVEQTIESIVNQTYKNIEFIIIDDGSKDNSPNIIKNLSEKYRFYFEVQQNMGLSATLNKMIKMAKGEYIALIASDDICTLEKIEILVKELENLDDEYGVVCGNAQFIDDEGKILVRKKNNHDDLIKYYASDRDDLNIMTEFGTYKSLLKGNYIPVLSTLIKRDALLEVGLYDEDLSLEDWSMWLKLSKKYKMKYVDKIVAFYRWHDSNITTTMSGRLALDVIHILEREKKYCTENNLMPVWRKKYYSAITFLLRNKDYKKFIEKLLNNNIFMFSIYVFEKTRTKLFPTKRKNYDSK